MPSSLRLHVWESHPEYLGLMDIDPRFVTLLRKLNQSNGGGGGGNGGFMVCQIFSNCFCAIVFRCVVYRVAGDHSPNKNGSCWMGSSGSRRCSLTKNQVKRPFTRRDACISLMEVSACLVGNRMIWCGWCGWRFVVMREMNNWGCVPGGARWVNKNK